MSIFDIFGLKSKLKEVFSKENIEQVINLAKESIIAKVPSEEEGEVKKAYVDTLVVKFLTSKASDYSGIVRWLVGNLLTSVVPAVTQLVYDHLKERVENLTKS